MIIIAQAIAQNIGAIHNNKVYITKKEKTGLQIKVMDEYICNRARTSHDTPM